MLLLICLPIISGMGLFPLMFLHLQGVLLRWQPGLRPAWGWIILTFGAVVIPFPTVDLGFDLRLVEHYYKDGLVVAFWYLAGVLISSVGWSLDLVLVLGSYLLIGVLYPVANRAGICRPHRTGRPGGRTRT